ncbi:MAG: FliG C-terminal domain-containing protein [Armatimonadota bacterium]
MALGTHELTGIDKASVLMMSLGASVSAKVFEHLSQTQRELLGAHIAGLRHVDDVTRSAVFEEVSRYVKSESVYESREELSVDSDEPLKWLEKLDPDDVAKLLTSERAQNVALVLAHLAPQAAAAVLARLDESTRNQTAHRLSTMRSPSREVIEAVDEVMRKRVAEVSERASNRKSHETLIGLLSNARQRVKESVVGAHSNSDSSARLTGSEILTIEDLADFTDTDIRAVVSQIGLADLCLAMRVVSEDVKSAIFRNASDELSLTIHRELTAPLQARLKEIELAQERIVGVMKQTAMGAAVE